MISPALAPDPLTTAHGSTPLSNWSLARTAPAAAVTPSHLEEVVSQWTPAPVPGTVAAALRAAGCWSLDGSEDFDASDWWYRCHFDIEGADRDAPARLRFDGLATLAEVWLNDELVLTSDNMFQQHKVDVGALLRTNNELVVCFRSLTAALATRRPRPRWKTGLVSHQQLRWFRTTLLGRMPGWSPRIAPVGPWRRVFLELPQHGEVADVECRAALDGHDGVLDVSCTIRLARDAELSGEVTVDDASILLGVERTGGECRLTGRLHIRRPTLWWPHTHGTPHLYRPRLRLGIDDRVTEHECNPVGFRRIEAWDLREGFALQINGSPVFCRGACWTSADVVTAAGSPTQLERDLTHLRDAGANMVRVGGTMVYEDDEFYRLCDELGLLVWQDFMFANMDYPVAEEAFLRSVTTEVTQQLQRLGPHPSVAVYCGNSEVEQQAAMLGLPREGWRNSLFGEILPELCARWHPDIPYVPSTPCGGALPFHVREGLAHYYGVGAYRQPLSSMRRADVKFTPECLGFSNVPEPAAVERLMEGGPPAIYDVRWKRGTPRDAGAGWDFDDVRDHYLNLLFGLDPERLRATDPGRYLEVSRLTTGEVMAAAFSEWRSAHSNCRGALIWFLKDLRPGAGWGLLDNEGTPKACFYFVRRSWQPQFVAITDEGLDGLHLHVGNETAEPLAGTLELTLLRDGRVITAQARTGCQIGPRGRQTFASDELLDGFCDASYSYKFGPPGHHVAAATLFDNSGTVVSEAFWFPDFREVLHPRSSHVRAIATRDGETRCVALTSDDFLYGVRIDVTGFLPDDNYFCLMPGREKLLRLRPAMEEGARFSGHVEALNLLEQVPIEGRDQ
jgi:beta-mannosidase